MIEMFKVDMPPCYNEVTPGSPAPSYKSEMGRPSSPAPSYKSVDLPPVLGTVYTSQNIEFIVTVYMILSDTSLVD